MSRENIDAVLAAYALFNSGERRPELDHWQENGEYETTSLDPDPGLHRGIDAVRKLFAGWVDTLPDLRVEPQEVRGLDDRVFTWVRFAGHGAESGLPVEMELAHVFTMREARIARCVEYLDRTEALEAAGLTD